MREKIAKNTAKKILVAPSLLSADFTRLGEEVNSICEAGADILHLDIMDGHFVPNMSFGVPIVSALHKFLKIESKIDSKQADGTSSCEAAIESKKNIESDFEFLSQKSHKIPLDVHLMVENAAKFIEYFAPFAPELISFHIEREAHAHRIIGQIKELGAKAGAVLCPQSSPALLEYLLADLDFVLIMSVNPGFGGQKFISQSIEKIRALAELKNKLNPNLLIEIDGGVCADNIKELKAAGVDIVVAGSYVFSGDYKAKIKSLKI